MGGVILDDSDQQEQSYDIAIIATHADEALHILSDPSSEEREALGAWTYERNRVVLHTDTSVMPPARRAWASWNYAREPNSGGSEQVSAHLLHEPIAGTQDERELLRVAQSAWNDRPIFDYS